VTEFLTLSQKTCLTAREFEATLRGDPALESWLLRQANSSYCQQARRITTLADATVVVGLERLKRMVYAVASRDLLDRRLHCYHFAEQGFWLHAIAVGVVARALAESRAEPAAGATSRPDGRAAEAPAAGDDIRAPLGPEAAFVAGMIHDVGKRLLDEVLPRRGGRRDVTRTEESACCGLDHAVLGGHIAASWNLPAAVVAAVAEHHAPDLHERADGPALVACADDVCRTWGAGLWTYPKTRLEPDPRPWQPLLRNLAIDPRGWLRLVDRLRPIVDGLAEMLRTCATNPVVELSSGNDEDTADGVSGGGKNAPSADGDRRSGRRRGRSRRDRTRRPARRGRSRRRS
jgi:HD-like signal output (HDOD) protein